MYATIDDLPVNVKSKYSEKAQTAYMETFNEVLKKTGDETRAFAAAAAIANKIDGIVSVKEVEFRGESMATAENCSYHIEGMFCEAAKHDEAKGVYSVPVTLITPGMSRNKVYYSESWLAKFAEKMNGRKAYLDHETKSEIKDRSSRSVRDVAGWYEGVHQDTDMSVKGTLNLVETPATEHIIKLAKANPALIGLSINARGKASRGKINGENAMIAETVDKVYSTDIVTEAAAGGEMMRFVAALEMDEEILDDKTSEIKNRENDMTDEQKTLVDWLLAESAHQGNVSAWLTAEVTQKLGELEKLTIVKATEAVLAEVPEQWRDHLKGEKIEKIEAFMEVLKAEKPKAPVTVAGNELDIQPGNKDFHRNFL